MNRITTFAGLFAVFFTLSSCQTIVIDFENGTPAQEPQQKQAQASMWLGLQEVSNPVSVNCTRGPAKIMAKRTPLDFLIHFAVGGVYTQISVAAYCPQ